MVKPKEIDRFDVNLVSENILDGYMLEVDLEYLEYSAKLYELHNDYPLAPEKLKIGHDILSNYCGSIVKRT